MLAVVPWVIDFIVDSGWAQEIVRSSSLTSSFISTIISFQLKSQQLNSLALLSFWLRKVSKCSMISMVIWIAAGSKVDFL